MRDFEEAIHALQISEEKVKKAASGISLAPPPECWYYHDLYTHENGLYTSGIFLWVEGLQNLRSEALTIYLSASGGLLP